MRISSSRVELHHRGGTRYLDVKISCCETSPKLGLAKKQNEPTGSSGPADMLKVNTSIRLAHGTRAPRCTLFGTVRRDTVMVVMVTSLSAPQHGVTNPACITSWFRTGFIVWISQVPQIGDRAPARRHLSLRPHAAERSASPSHAPPSWTSRARCAGRHHP